MTAHKHMVIIGVGPGISRSLINKFGKEGYRVSMLGRNQEKLINLCDELKAANINASYFLADSAHFQNLAQAILASIEQYGKPEVMIYNAAAIRKGKPLAHFADDFVNDFKVNVAGALQSVQTVAPHMDQLGYGTILLTGGGLAHYPNSEYASLSIGKSGILCLAKLLHQELAPKGVRVGTVTINGFVQKGTAFDPDKIAEVYWELHQKSAGQDWEVETLYNG